MRPPASYPADFRSELGLRSLDPDRSFWSAYAELIRGPSSPADFCNVLLDVRATKPGLLRSSQGRRPRPPSFSDASRLFLEGSGDARRAALRPSESTPVPVPPAGASLPDRDAESTPHHPGTCAPERSVRFDVHGPKDRAKDASPSACDDLSCLRRVHTLCGVRRRRSPPRQPSGIRCHRRAHRQRRIPLPRQAGRPSPSLQRRPAKSGTIRKARMPFTVACAKAWEGGNPSGHHGGSLAHAAHTLSRTRDKCFGWALQGHGSRSSAGP